MIMNTELSIKTDNIIFSVSRDYQLFKKEIDIVSILKETDEHIYVSHYDGSITKINKLDLEIVDN